MDGVVPVVIVIGVLPVPPAVMRLQSVMGPADPGVCAGNDNVLPVIPERPYLRRMRVTDARLDGGGNLRV